MTTVRVARIERRIPPGPVPDRVPTPTSWSSLTTRAAGTCRSGCSAGTATDSPTTRGPGQARTS